MSSEGYDVSVDYSGFTISNPVLFKCLHNFSTGLSNTSVCVQVGSGGSGDVISASVVGFSSFFVVDDTCVGVCGGKCPVCPSGTGGSGGGGSGGGGGSHQLQVLDVPDCAPFQA